MNFDPNATPESNVFGEVVKGDAWLCMAAQEKAKRRAQHQYLMLKEVALELAKILSGEEKMNEIFEEIERIGT